MREDCVRALRMRHPASMENRGLSAMVLKEEGLNGVQPGHFWVVDKALDALDGFLGNSVSNGNLGLRFVSLDYGENGLSFYWRWREAQTLNEINQRNALEAQLAAILRESRDLCAQCGIALLPEEKRANTIYSHCKLCSKKRSFEILGSVVALEKSRKGAYPDERIGSLYA